MKKNCIYRVIALALLCFIVFAYYDDLCLDGRFRKLRNCFATDKAKGRHKKFAAELKRILDFPIMRPLEKARPLFNFTITPWKYKDIDQKYSSKMIVMVKSKSENKLRRDIARKTWCSYPYPYDLHVLTMFIVGRGEDYQTEIVIRREAKLYGDLLQINLTEKYTNIGYKTLAGMQWATEHFSQDWYYSSADDDMMPNLITLHKELKHMVQQWEIGQRNADLQTLMKGKKEKIVEPIYCGYGYKLKSHPKRFGESKWYLEERDYPLKRYPPYCYGGWYTMRIELAKELYNLSKRLKFFWIDDVWITGFLRHKYFMENDLKCSYCLKDYINVGLWIEKSENFTIATTGNETELLSEWKNIESNL